MTSETMKSYLESLLKQAIKELGFNFSDVQITFPDSKFGDYSTNVGLVLAKKENKNPKEVAELIIKKIKELDRNQSFEKAEEVKGFINFTVFKEILVSQLSSILEKKDKFGALDIGKEEKILVEYFQPNIAKPLHLGHLGTAIIGDCLFRILSFVGYKAESDTHIGDWGTQFGLLLAAYKKYGDDKVIEKDPINELNKLYIKINKEIENDPAVRETGKGEFVKLERGDEENRKLWKKFKDWSWQEFEVAYHQLGIRKSDHDWPESFFEDKMPAVVEELKEHQLLRESDGAQVVDLEKHNLGVAIIIKSDGGTTYLLRDLATYIYRKSMGFKKQFYVVDVRQSHTLAQTFKVLELLGYITEKEEAVHVAYGFLTLPEGAMSTRKGSMVGAREFLEAVRVKAFEVVKEKNPDLENKERVAKIVASASVKYFNLSRNIKSDIVFDPKKAVSFEGNTGPYLQYTHARIFGILRKNQEPKAKNQTNLKSGILNLKPEELSVLRKLHQFPEVVERTAKEFQPNIICNYLFELSQNFNNFYQNVPVLQEEDAEKRSFRLQLITGTAQVIKNGLGLLGIEAPEEM